MRRVDVAVIGAGPAGSMAAYELARAGARVAMLDRAEFPRDKPCGGGVLISAAKLLPFPLDPVVEREIRGFRVRYRRGREYEHDFDQPLALMTQRRKLDAYLAERAQEAGAEFRQGEAAREIEGTIVRTADGALEADCIIGADGANGVSRRALGLPRQRAAVALEGNAARSGAGAERRWSGHVGLELGTMSGGYGWVFPKGDHCNLGAGGFPPVGAGLRRELAEYAESEGFDGGSLSDLRGHHLPLRDPGDALHRGRTALAGDAAGLIDPLSGEGIGNAIRSGQLAAAAALRILAGEAEDFAGYAAAVEREIEPELAAARDLQALFHFSPRPYVELLQRSDRFWRSFCRIVRGDATYCSFRARLGPAVGAFAAAASFARRRVHQRAQWAPPR